MINDHSSGERGGLNLVVYLVEYRADCLVVVVALFSLA
jgi:hypothetical protein